MGDYKTVRFIPSLRKMYENWPYLTLPRQARTEIIRYTEWGVCYPVIRFYNRSIKEPCIAFEMDYKKSPALYGME